MRRVSESVRCHGRRGVILIVVLVCFAVAMAMLVAVVKIAAAGRKMVDNQAWQAQATWLAESGLDRAAWRLAHEPDYQGETWTLSAEELAGSDGGSDGGVVEIQIEAVADQPDQRLVRIRADYPNDLQHRWRQGKQALVRLAP